MDLAGEIADFAREHFEAPDASLDPASDIIAIFNAKDPDWCSDFFLAVSRRYGVRLPTGVRRIDRLTIEELCAIVRAGEWPDE